VRLGKGKIIHDEVGVTPWTKDRHNVSRKSRSKEQREKLGDEAHTRVVE
jgi:hypothetical protein